MRIGVKVRQCGQILHHMAQRLVERDVLPALSPVDHSCENLADLAYNMPFIQQSASRAARNSAATASAEALLSTK